MIKIIKKGDARKMPIPKISIRALKALISVYEEQSFSRAAARDNATQSGMSMQIKTLEERLGVKVLERARNQLNLTAEGRILYDDGRKIIKSLVEAEEKISARADTLQGSLKIGIIPALTRSVVQAALSQFKTIAPMVEISLVEEYSGSLINRVVAGEIDFAIVPAGPIGPGLDAEYIAQDNEMLLCNSKMFPEYSHLSTAPLSSLKKKKLIVPSHQNVRRIQIEKLLDSYQIEVSDLLEMDGMLATIELVAQSDWVAILPSAICHADLDGRMRKSLKITEPAIPLDYIMVKRNDVTFTLPAQKMAEQIKYQTKKIISEFQENSKLH